LLAGCARDAPSLPPIDAAASVTVGTSSEPDRLERCATLRREIIGLRSEMSTIEDVMKGHRTADQVGGYLSVLLFPPLLLVADQQAARKSALDERQAQVDHRLAEERALHCPSA